MKTLRIWLVLALVVAALFAPVALHAGDGSSSLLQTAKNYLERAAVFFGDLWAQISEKLSEWTGGSSEEWQEKATTFFSRFKKAGTMMREVSERVNLVPLDEKQAVIFLKNGSSISCKIVNETAKKVVVEWEGGEVTFGRNEIVRIERKRMIAEGDGIRIAEPEPEAGWKYKHDIVVRLTNGQVIDAVVSEVHGPVVVLKEDLGGGSSIDHEVERSKIEALDFRPVSNPASDKIAGNLRRQFPKMRFYEDGIITLVTDSSGSSLKTLKKTLQDQVKEVYLEFFPLLKNRKPEVQVFVVVFDKFQDWFEYALTDGVHPFYVGGYFDPVDEILFLPNKFGDEMSGNVRKAVEFTRQGLNQMSDTLKSRYGDKYEAQIEGAFHDAKVAVDNYIDFVMGVLMNETMHVLRHEFVHSFFHSFKSQSIIISKINKSSEALLRKKADLLASSDPAKKAELLKEILKIQSKRDKQFEKLETNADNSWFVEGVAEYAGTYPVGGELGDRLFDVKEAEEQKQLLPLEHLTVYKSGSFVGVERDSKLSAYAQSWSLVHFLMKRYPEGFLRYLDRMAGEKPSEADDLNWLLEAVGKDLRVLESEWHEHIAAMPTPKDPEIEIWWRVRDIFGMND